MRYPIAIELPEDGSEYGVIVPDLPGCFSSGGTLDEAVDNTREAIELWLDVAIDREMSIPSAGSLETYKSDPEFSGWILSFVDIDMSQFSDKSLR
jgi:predicted RNase H-like HicB family nuclease